MKFSAIVFALGSIAVSATSAFQNLQTSDAQLNISSPLLNGIYVAGKILPFTYIPAIPANLRLNIFLKGSNVLFNETAIAYNADISNNPANAAPDVVDQTVYYQHSINYDIPTTAPAGNYEVIYQNVNTNLNTTIPISILPYVAPTAAPSTTQISIAPAPTTAIIIQPSDAANTTSA